MKPIEKTYLILLYGTGSGFGKSTLDRGIVQHMQQTHETVFFVEEHDTQEIIAFAPYVARVQKGYAGDIATLTICCQHYIQQLAQKRPEITVLDSILPCWDWLLSADCPVETVAQFSNMLQDQLERLNPILIIVDGDPDVALARAITERGKSWMLDQAELRTGKRSVVAFRNYQQQLRQMAEPLLSAWRYKLVRVNTTHQDIAQSLQFVLNQISPELNAIHHPQQ